MNKRCHSLSVNSTVSIPPKFPGLSLEFRQRLSTFCSRPRKDPDKEDNGGDDDDKEDNGDDDDDKDDNGGDGDDIDEAISVWLLISRYRVSSSIFAVFSQFDSATGTITRLIVTEAAAISVAHCPTLNVSFVPHLKPLSPHRFFLLPFYFPFSSTLK